MIRHLHTATWFFTGLLAIAQLGYWYNVLPDVVPSHFDSQGNIDSEMGKTAFTALFVGMHLMFLVGFPLIGNALRRVPDSMINVPNKEYWLAPERRSQTIEFNRQMLTFFGYLTSWLMMGCFHLTAIVATTDRTSIEPEFIWILGIYLAIVFGFLGFIMFRFRSPEKSQLNLEPTNG